MLRVRDLKLLLNAFPDDAVCNAYEGENVGIVIDHAQCTTAFIYCDRTDDDQFQSQRVAPAELLRLGQALGLTEMTQWLVQLTTDQILALVQAYGVGGGGGGRGSKPHVEGTLPCDLCERVVPRADLRPMPADQVCLANILCKACRDRLRSHLLVMGAAVRGDGPVGGGDE